MRLMLLATILFPSLVPGQELLPKEPVIPWTPAAVAPDGWTGRILFKLHDDLPVSVAGDRLASPVDVVIADVLRVLGGRVVRRLFPEPAAFWDALRAEASRRTGRALADLNTWFLAEVGTAVDPVPFCLELSRSPFVETAYPEGAHGEPGDIPPVTPLFTSGQGYLGAPPQGVNAPYAWRFAGGNGAGVRVIDVERGWNFQHEDLTSARNALIIGPLNSGSIQHGTAVLGEMVADRDAWGVDGISYAAEPKAVSVFQQSIAMGLGIAVMNTLPGDVILIEQQLTSPALLPVEYEQANYDAIVAATAAGRIVTEAAGNGNQNLDAATWGGRFDRAVRDSRAILVGAGDGQTLARLSFSNYGTRLDAQGWGQSVTTTGYGPLFNPGGDQNQWYTSGFNGTSSASPIVTGAAIDLIGATRTLLGRLLTPAEVRTILVATGSPEPPTTTRIGPRPDLKRAFARAGLILSRVADVAPGARFDLELFDPENAGRAYLAAASLASTPGFLLGDGRRVPLVVDVLFVASLLGGPPTFQQFVGVLDGSGASGAGVQLPAVPELAGFAFQVAALVLDGAAPSGVARVSNPARLLVLAP